MPDSPDQIICKLQQENKKLKPLKQKDEELNRERQLWNNRETGWDPSTSTDLHRIEVFDGVISDESSLHPATLCSREEFRYILERAGACAIASGDMPLFRDDESRMSDPGNRCKLRFRHALLMSLIRKKDNPTQGTLQAIFGVDQTSVCRYLKVMNRILASVLPTAKNVSKEIAACKTKEEFKRMVPGPGGGDVTADGTHCPVQHPSEKTIRSTIYSGKKKRFTHNTNVYTNRDGVIIGISESTVGSVGDITLLKERPMPFGKWEEAMHDADRPEGERNRIFCDRGLQGIADHLPGTAPMIPYKRTKKSPLTREQREHNSRINSERVLVEHSIGRLKRYDRITDPYDGTAAQFNREFNVITGLVNLHLLWDHVRKEAPPGEWKTSVDWERARSTAPVK